MSISQITTDITGEIDVNPRLVRIVCNDSYATITTAGYLSGQQHLGFEFKTTDFFFIMYGANSDTPGLFNASFSGNEITLYQELNQGNVTLPVVSGDVASFSGTTGLIADSGIAASSLVLRTGATVVNNVPKFNSITGGVIDSGVAISALQLAANIKANTVANAGGSASFSIAVSGLTASSKAVCTFQSQANAASVLTATCGTNVINIVASADPGACVVSFVAFVVAQ